MLDYELSKISKYIFYSPSITVKVNLKVIMDNFGDKKINLTGFK